MGRSCPSQGLFRIRPATHSVAEPPPSRLRASVQPGPRGSPRVPQGHSHGKPGLASIHFHEKKQILSSKPRALRGMPPTMELNS